MDYEMKVGSALCYLPTFRINGVEARHEDFGELYDDSPDTAEPYGCGDMRFFPKPAAPEVLEKYRITEAEYDTLAAELTEKLSFGSCGWCV